MTFKKTLIATLIVVAFIIGLLIGCFLLAKARTVRELEIRWVYPSFKVVDLAKLKGNVTVVFWYSRGKAAIQLCADEERLVKVGLYLFSEGRKIKETSFLYKVLPLGELKEIELDVGNETITDFVIVIQSVGK